MAKIPQENDLRLRLMLCMAMLPSGVMLKVMTPYGSRQGSECKYRTEQHDKKSSFSFHICSF